MALNNSLNTTLVTKVMVSFSILDYILFAAFLCISGGIGIYFSIRGQRSTNDYFFGGRKMGPVPIGISTGVSFMSATFFVGLPAEMFINGYTYSINILVGCLSYFVGCVAVSSLLHSLDMTSVSQYIDRRFDSKLLTWMANVMVLLCIFQYMGVCMLGSVIAFASITGGQVSVVLALSIGGIVGIFYTSIGGLRAVVWTDVLQCGVMLFGILSVIVKAMADTSGGIVGMVETNVRFGRIHEPNWSIDPRVRHGFWGLVIGGLFSWSQWSVQPAGVQRLCSIKSKRDSYIAALIASLLFIVFSLLPCLAGLSIFGYYMSRDCDVHAAGWIQPNEIILYFVRDRLNWPGFQGLFVAALYAGSLSSLSSGLNAASAILWGDLIKPLIRVSVSEVRAVIISKLLVLVFGVLSMFWCFTLYSIGDLIVQLSNSFFPSMFGAYFIVFLFGAVFRVVTYQGQLAGMLAGFAFTFWLGLGSVLYGNSKKTTMATNTTGCAFDLNATESSGDPATYASVVLQDKSVLNDFYSVSYMWFAPICTVVSLLVSLSVSACTYHRRLDPVSEDLLFAICRRNFWRRNSRNRDRKESRHDGDVNNSSGGAEADNIM